MTTLQIEIGEPYKEMLEVLREHGDSDPDADLRALVENAIHNGYQQIPE